MSAINLNRFFLYFIPQDPDPDPLTQKIRIRNTAKMVTLLVITTIQGYWTKASWGFPKGKINQDEDASVCAAR